MILTHTYKLTYIAMCGKSKPYPESHNTGLFDTVWVQEYISVDDVNSEGFTSVEKCSCWLQATEHGSPSLCGVCAPLTN